MSGSSQEKGGFSRRAVAVGGGIAAALGIAALGVSVPRWLGKHYAKSQYDDLFAALVDRESAAKVGQRLLGRLDGDPRYTVQTLAAELRARLKGRTLAQASAADIADDKLAEVAGWVLPATLTMLCLLAAAEER